MMRFVQIIVLWISGTFLIAHTVIPHHHHTLQQNECNEERTHHEHSNCNHDHSSSHSKPIETKSICKLDQLTIIKKSEVVFFAIVIATLKIKIIPVPVATFNTVYLLKYVPVYYCNLLSNRAPPQV